MDPFKKLLKKLRQENRDVPFVAYSTLFGRHSLLVLDCDLIKFILTQPTAKDPVRFPKRYVLLREILGDGLVTLDEGSAWSRHRRLIQPAFQTSFLRDSLNDCVPALTEKLVKVWNKTEGCTINLDSHMSALTLDILGKVAFSHDFGACKLLEDWARAPERDLKNIQDPLIQSLQASFRVNFFNAALAILQLSWIHTLISGKTRRTRRVLNQAVDDIIEHAKNVVANDRQHCLLNRMMEATDSDPGLTRNRLSDLELRDEIKTFVIAGHETT
jgi:cytochrome P450